MADQQTLALARRLRALEKVVTSRKSPQLAQSAIVGGALTATDIYDNVTMQIGQQFDGSNVAAVITGPTPPTPSAPDVEPGIKMLIVSWDGLWADPSAVVPMDFSRVEVHVSTEANFEPDLETTLKSTIESPRGGRVVVALPYDQEFHVRLVARSLAGKGSEPSDDVAGTPTRIESLDIEPLAITGDKIDDFSLAVTKFQSTTHMLY